MTPDFDLLARYAAERDEAAFAELVQRHLDHVYSTALRLVGGDSHLAEDVSQSVFTDLARKAGSLRGHATLSGWLHTSTCFAASNLIRTEQRRRQREQTALTMSTTTAPEPDWDQVRAFLDDSIAELGDPDRDAIMLRYFERKPLAEVGEALGMSEDAARMRVDRAVDKLRTRLAVRGITSTAAALTTLLAKDLVGSAPAALGSRITARALADAVVASTATGASVGMSATGKLAITTALVAVVGVVLFFGFKGSPRASGTSAPAMNRSPVQVRVEAPAPRVMQGAPRAETPQQGGLALLFVDAQTGLPITNQEAILRGWEKGHFTMVNKPVSLDAGRCVAPFDPTVQPNRFQILTHIEGYADTHLRWSPGRGEVVPESYTVRLVRPALIHGRVLDMAGHPVAGATVGFNTENLTAQDTVTEDHSIDYLTVKTDTDGSWEINRLALKWCGTCMGRHLIRTMAGRSI
jgi:RNA polymerase sigma factor (sigma-70 family)